MEWQYKHEDPLFDDIPNGAHRIRIKSAEKKISKRSGNDMVELQFEVSGHKSILFHYITFLVDKPEVTNRMLTALFDSFGIDEGDFNMRNWIGKVGACMVKHDDEDRAKVAYLIQRKKQDTLPAWQEPGAKSGVAPAGGAGGFTPVEDTEDLPF